MRLKVIAQSHTDWECLVMDDGSTEERSKDEDIRIVDELDDQRVCLATLERKQRRRSVQ